VSATRPLFGFHAVTARLRQQAASVEAVYVDAARHDMRMRDLAARARAANVPIHAVDAARLAALTGHETHQGVVAIVDARRPHVTLDDVLSDLMEPALLLVLDGVTDPHNLGACAAPTRSARRRSSCRRTARPVSTRRWRKRRAARPKPFR
jgi:23S rRNA (guanosine2251-2'-O)-methyltransferase